MEIIYFFVALLATIGGAVAGIGGGVIIKPVLDTLGHYDLTTIGILSSFTVLSMAIVSIIKQLRQGFVVKKSLLILAIGSLLGGAIGKGLFSIFINSMDSDIAKIIQSLMLAGLMFFVLFRDRLPKWHIKNIVLTLIIGVLLGTIASFLGIGGGPINIAILIMLLGMDSRAAAIGSIFIILISQTCKLFLIWMDTGFAVYDITMLWFMIPAGVMGGLIGSKLNHRLSIQNINVIFNAVIIFVIALNMVNFINFIIR